MEFITLSIKLDDGETHTFNVGTVEEANGWLVVKAASGVVFQVRGKNIYWTVLNGSLE